MKGLTLTQPWASLVACGAKKIETRSFSTKYRGPLAIHAAKTIPKEVRDDLLSSHHAIFVAIRQALDERFDHFALTADVPLGAILATAQLTACIRIDGSLFAERVLLNLDKQERYFGNYGYGRYMWMLEDIKPLEKPIPIRGALGLWEVPDGVVQQDVAP